MSKKKAAAGAISPMYCVRAIVVLDSEGGRIAAKYYSQSGLSGALKEQQAFERRLALKTLKQPSEVVMLENATALYRAAGDVHIFVVGASDENELLLLNVLNTLHEALQDALRGQIDKRSMLENLDTVLLVLDELVDDGIILETDPQLVATRATMRNVEGEASLPEQTLTQALHIAREQIIKALR